LDALPFATMQHADASDLIAPIENRHARNADHARLAQSGRAELRDLDVVGAQVLHMPRGGDHRAEAGAVERVGRHDQRRAAFAACRSMNGNGTAMTSQRLKFTERLVVLRRVPIAHGARLD
jgi:hypothetical protein